MRLRNHVIDREREVARNRAGRGRGRGRKLLSVLGAELQVCAPAPRRLCTYTRFLPEKQNPCHVHGQILLSHNDRGRGNMSVAFISDAAFSFLAAIMIVFE